MSQLFCVIERTTIDEKHSKICQLHYKKKAKKVQRDTTIGGFSLCTLLYNKV